MKHLRKIVIVVCSMIILGGWVIGQSRAPQKGTSPRTPSAPSTHPANAPNPRHSVIVKMKKGDLIGGLFVRADAEALHLDLKGEARTLRLNEIENISFLSEEPQTSRPTSTPAQPSPTPDIVIVNGRKAYTALRKLATGAQLKLPYNQYAQLLIETKVIVDESVAALPEGAVKANLVKAHQAFIDAGQAWGAASNVGVLPITTEPGTTLMQKYSIKPAVNAVGQEDRLLLDVTLITIWEIANKELNAVAPMLGLN